MKEHLLFPFSEVVLPDWLWEAQSAMVTPLPDAISRMRWVLGLAEKNVELGSGGPFAAAIFDTATGLPVAAGVNRVTPTGCALAHAEMLALAAAQRRLGTWDLADGKSLEIVSSAEPCLMCLGGVMWSGVRRLVYGARDEDIRAIGFDEGPKPDQWPKRFIDRGIEVVGDVLRQEASDVLSRYASAGGKIYSPSR